MVAVGDLHIIVRLFLTQKCMSFFLQVNKICPNWGTSHTDFRMLGAGETLEWYKNNYILYDAQMGPNDNERFK